MEMTEVTVDPEPTHVPGRPPPPAKLMDIGQLLERYSLMATTMHSSQAVCLPGVDHTGREKL